MQEDVWVTVICSCYNHSGFVTESLKSVLNQSHKNTQLIVVDDFSNDNSVAVIEDFIKKYPEIIFIKNTTNLGLTKSFNHAMQLAKGQYFIDLAADDILLSNCIEIQLNTFKNSRYENLAIVYGNAEFISEKGTHISHYFDVDCQNKTIEKKPSGNIYAEIISTKTVICSVSSMVKKLVFDELKGYDENLSYEDLDFWIRTSRNHNIEFIDAILVQKRILNNSLHANFFKSKNKHGYSTYQILKKAFKLNRNKKEHQILLGRIYLEIKITFKTTNYILALKNFILLINVGLKSI
ncbi:glycosyltransferase family 2 protein [Flavobacterium sp.]|uniref:glycosyltransferase family 2 protein n=1 Tax=Flavobacterium sp. TaxID=239 RepID=UPI0038FC185A